MRVRLPPQSQTLNQYVMAKKQLTLVTSIPLMVDTDKIDGNKLSTFMAVVETLGLDNALTLFGNGIEKCGEKYELR